MLKMPSIDPPGQERIMLFQVKKGVWLAVLVMASLSSTATAGAATATITGGPTFSGTSTTSTLLKLHTAAKTLSCTGSTANGTVAASTDGAFLPRYVVGTMTPSFTGCNIVGGLGITVTCQPSDLDVGAVTAAGSTKGAVTDLSCHIFVTTQTACRIDVGGAVSVTYANAPAMIVTNTNHQELNATNSSNGAGAACSLLPNDASARLVNASNGDLQYNVSPTNLNVNVTSSAPCRIDFPPEEEVTYSYFRADRPASINAPTFDITNRQWIFFGGIDILVKRAAGSISTPLTATWTGHMGTCSLFVH
jgi:hypothetical protein